MTVIERQCLPSRLGRWACAHRGNVRVVIPQDPLAPRPMHTESVLNPVRPTIVRRHARSLEANPEPPADFGRPPMEVEKSVKFFS